MTVQSSKYPQEIPIRAGRLRHWVDIEEKVTDQSESGAPITHWVPFVKNIPAEVIDGKGHELLAGGQEQAYMFTTVTIRKIPGVKSAMRVQHKCCGGDVLNISAVLDDPSEKSYSELWCARGMNLG
jgi:SPP1 family predicted phage head-tail adaptor